MNIVFFAHPDFLGQQSMPRFARMLAAGMKRRGHTSEIVKPNPQFFNTPVPAGMRKWMGYLDQYVIFPLQVKGWLKTYPENTLFVFTDHALGPWIPLVKDRPHIIHCHDFLAQRSALGEIPENPTKFSGRLYQAFIRRGYSKGKNFISVSNKTEKDLHRFLSSPPSLSEVVYNGLNQSFSPNNPDEARRTLGGKTGIDLSTGYLLHVGGNEWYKNRSGVIEIYNAWRSSGREKTPLLLVGNAPNHEIGRIYNQSPFKAEIHLLSGLEDESVRLAYTGASVFLFPSLAEGFGWPIAEAMASGCPVITTDEAPMTEVGGNAAFYIPKRPLDNTSVTAWAMEGAKALNDIFALSSNERKSLVESSIANSKRFDPDTALDKIEEIYKSILYPER